VLDKRPEVTGSGGDRTVIRQQPRIRITSTTTSSTTTTTTTAPVTTFTTVSTTTSSSTRVNDDSSTTEIVVEDFSNFKRRGTTPSPISRPPTDLRTFPAVPGLSPDDINSMSKNELTEMVRGTPNPNVSEKLSTNVIEMIVDVIKRTGKELTDNDVDVIADAAKEMGENLGKVSYWFFFSFFAYLEV
jgi:hypothetical protein